MSTKTQDPQSARFLDLWSEIEDLRSAEGALGWDQETFMPPKGQPGRGRVLSTLAGLKHAKLCATELSDLISALSEQVEPQSDWAAQIAEAKRLSDRARNVPSKLAKDLAAAASSGLVAWQTARAEQDFSLFSQQLEHVVALRKEEAAAIDSSQDPYDVLIDEYEPGGRQSEIAAVFDTLKAELTPLVQAVKDSGLVIDESPVQGQFAASAQLAFASEIAQAMGFDFEAGRIDSSAHPFCSGLHRGDVRLTWRHLDHDFRSALYGIMHEAGHGLYEQGLPQDWEGTPLGAARSMSIHESQSRLWENLVGRSRGFWRWALPSFHKHFPHKSDVTVEQIYPALHTVVPSFIRVEADEGTYNLHVIARFEIERKLFAGEIEVKDLPTVWDDTYEELLGIRPNNVSEGILQDIHWSMGAFGYFPTYALGNLVNAQLFESAEADLGPQEQAFERGEFAPLLNWLREKVHQHGARYRASELVQKATGQPMSAQPFLNYLKRVTKEIYGV